MILPSPTPALNVGRLGHRELRLTFDGERIVSDTGLLAVRAIDQHFRVLADVAARLPDPRSPRSTHHSAEALLTQAVYQILAGYPDHNDAGATRDDPLFQILAGVAPDPERPLASGSTLARFQYAFTRRDAERPPEERPVLAEVDRAQTQRLKVLNRHLVDLFLRTRPPPPRAARRGHPRRGRHRRPGAWRPGPERLPRLLPPAPVLAAAGLRRRQRLPAGRLAAARHRPCQLRRRRGPGRDRGRAA